MYYEYVHMHVLMCMYVYVCIYVCASVCMHMCLCMCWEWIFEERELTYPDSESICYFPVVG